MNGLFASMVHQQTCVDVWRVSMVTEFEVEGVAAAGVILES
jgi:hypothetical protein